VFGSTALSRAVINKLSPITTAIDKVVLARAFSIQEWMEDAYADLVLSDALPSYADCERLGFHTSMQLARVREKLMQSDDHSHNSAILDLSTWFSDIVPSGGSVVAGQMNTHFPGGVSSQIESDLMAYACKPSSSLDAQVEPFHAGNLLTPRLSPRSPRTLPEVVSSDSCSLGQQSPDVQAQISGSLSPQLTGGSYDATGHASLTSSVISLADTSDPPPMSPSASTFSLYQPQPLLQPPSDASSPNVGTGAFEYRHGVYIPLGHRHSEVIGAGRADDCRGAGDVGSPERPIGKITRAFVEDATDIDE
jgi:hypothetical protein